MAGVGGGWGGAYPGRFNIQQKYFLKTFFRYIRPEKNFSLVDLHYKMLIMNVLMTDGTRIYTKGIKNAEIGNYKGIL